MTKMNSGAGKRLSQKGVVKETPKPHEAALQQRAILSDPRLLVA